MLRPITDQSLVVRTDFSDQRAWRELCAAISQPVGGFRACVEFYSDPALDGFDAARLVAEVAPDSRSFLFVADRHTLEHPEHPVLVIDLFEEPGRTFRVVPSEMWAVENNLSIANLDFAEFADAVDADGVFRGFPR